MTTDCFWAAAGVTASSAASEPVRARTRARRARFSMDASLLEVGDGSRASGPSLLGHEAAVDDHLRPGHERRLVGGEEEGGVRDVPGLADAAERDPGLELGPQRVGEIR